MYGLEVLATAQDKQSRLAPAGLECAASNGMIFCFLEVKCSSLLGSDAGRAAMVRLYPYHCQRDWHSGRSHRCTILCRWPVRVDLVRIDPRDIGQLVWSGCAMDNEFSKRVKSQLQHRLAWRRRQRHWTLRPPMA